MWYTDHSKKELDLSKPIVAENKRGEKHLLLPQIIRENYTVIGYNWFSLTEGTYGSSTTWGTAEEAIKCRKDGRWNVYNVIIDVRRITNFYTKK